VGVGWSFKVCPQQWSGFTASRRINKEGFRKLLAGQSSLQFPNGFENQTSMLPKELEQTWANGLASPLIPSSRGPEYPNSSDHFSAAPLVLIGTG